MCGLSLKLSWPARAHTIDTCRLTMEFHPGWDFVTTSSLLCWGFVWLGRVQVLGVLWQPRWVHVCMCPAVFGEHGFLAVTHCLWLLSSFGLFLWDAPRVFGGGAVIEMSHPVLITKLLWRWRLTQRGLTIGEGTENGDCGVPIPNRTIHHSILFDPSSLLISFPFLSSPSPSPTPLRHTHKFSPYDLDCPSAHNPLASAFQGWGTLWNLGSESSHKRRSSDCWEFFVIEKYSVIFLEQRDILSGRQSYFL